MASKAEALVIVIDVSPSMTNPGEDGKSPLEKCVTAANMILQRKIFTDTKKNKDEAALILFGTEGTDNSLNQGFGAGNYENITLSREMNVIDMEMLKFVNNDVVPGTANGDFIDALVVALDHLNTKCSGRKMDQKVVLFSDLQHEFNADKLDSIIGGMKGNSVNLIFVGPDINSDDSEGSRNQGPTSKPLSKQQMLGVRCMDHILEEVDGDGISIDDVLPMLSYFELRRKKQVTTYRGTIDIGSNLKINTWSYVKVKEERPASWKKLSALAENAANRDTLAVDIQRTYHLNDADRTDVEIENVAKAYRYGKTIVPMTAEDQKSMKLQTTKSCKVLGFTSCENVPRNLYTRDVCHILTPQPGDQHAAVAFSSLCHALAEKKMVAIVRYVARGNTDPKLGFLSPHIKSQYDSLIFIALPYREDLRSYLFSSLENTKTQNQSTEQHDSAVDALIDNMGLVEKVTKEEDSEKEQADELYKPSELLNPVNQRQCQCIQSRALYNLEGELPNVEEYIERTVRVKPVVAQRCEATLTNLKNLFPLEEAETKKKDIFKEEEKTDAPKDNSAAKEKFELNDITDKSVDKIGLTDPVGDFQVMIGKSSNTEEMLGICNQLCSIILRLVTESFLDQHYQKALNCIQEIRAHCSKVEKEDLFNSLIDDLKSVCVGKRRQDFWDLLTNAGIKPFARGNDIVDTPSERNKEKAEEQTESVVDDGMGEDAEDLLDLL